MKNIITNKTRYFKNSDKYFKFINKKRDEINVLKIGISKDTIKVNYNMK